jgi:hypothetical protein
MYTSMGQTSQPGQIFPLTQMYPIRPLRPSGEQQLPPEQVPPSGDTGFWAGLTTIEKAGVVAGGAAVLGLLYYAFTR